MAAGTYNLASRSSATNSCPISLITNPVTLINQTNASLLNLVSPEDDYSANTILKTASSVNGKIVATNKVTGTANVTYSAKNIELNAGFKADNGSVFKAEIGGCN